LAREVVGTDSILQEDLLSNIKKMTKRDLENALKGKVLVDKKL